MFGMLTFHKHTFYYHWVDLSLLVQKTWNHAAGRSASLTLLLLCRPQLA